MKAILVLTFLLSGPAMAAPSPGIGEAFEIEAGFTHYYGRRKSAESAMWSKAQKVCARLQEETKSNNALVLNRESEVTFREEGHQSFARARFVCRPVGLAG